MTYLKSFLSYISRSILLEDGKRREGVWGLFIFTHTDDAFLYFLLFVLVLVY